MAVTWEDLQGACQQVTVHGHYFTALCPFHNDTAPSLLVFKDGWWRCLGSCGRNGRWETLWNKLKGQPLSVIPERKTRWSTPSVRPEDLEEVCYQAHMDLLGFETLGWYMEMRGVADRIETNEIGYWDGWYTIPVRNEKSEFITAVFRAAPHVQEATGLRYWCPHSPVMFVPDWRIVRHSKHLIVVYGMIDALALASLRLPVVTTTGGQLTFRPEWLETYRYPVYVVPDKGEEAAARKLVSQLDWRGKLVKLDYPEGLKDPADFLKAGKREELLRQLGGF